MSEEYSVGYSEGYQAGWNAAEGYQAGWNAAMDATPPPAEFVCSTGLCHYKPAAAVQPTKDVEISNMGNPFTVKAYTTPPAAAVQPLPFGVGGGLVAIKTLLSRDPCVHANTAIEMIDAILKEHPAAQRKWVPVTKELLSAQHPWLYESMWIAMKDGRVMTGHYAWMQGRYPDRFLVGDCASLWAFEATHVMPMNQPKHPAKLKEKNT